MFDSVLMGEMVFRSLNVEIGTPSHPTSPSRRAHAREWAAGEGAGAADGDGLQRQIWAGSDTLPNNFVCVNCTFVDNNFVPGPRRAAARAPGQMVGTQPKFTWVNPRTEPNGRNPTKIGWKGGNDLDSGRYLNE